MGSLSTGTVGVMALSGAVDTLARLALSVVLNPLAGMESLDAVNTASGAALLVVVNPVGDVRRLFFRRRTPDLVDGDGFVAGARGRRSSKQSRRSILRQSWSATSLRVVRQRRAATRC